MVQEVLPSIQYMISSLFGFFSQIMDRLNAWGIFLGAFFVWTVVRFLIAPLIGGVLRAGTSDMVKKVHGSSSSAKKSSKNGDLDE